MLKYLIRAWRQTVTTPSQSQFKMSTLKELYYQTQQNSVMPLTHNVVIITIFARSDAAATIYFIARFCAASIRERRLIKSGVIHIGELEPCPQTTPMFLMYRNPIH